MEVQFGSSAGCLAWDRGVWDMERLLGGGGLVKGVGSLWVVLGIFDGRINRLNGFILAVESGGRGWMFSWGVQSSIQFKKFSL